MNSRHAGSAVLVAIVTMLLAGALLQGCIVRPVAPAYFVGEPVPAAPPPPRQEFVGVAPAPGYFWISGYWTWTGGRHEWLSGRWQAPRDGYRWVPHHWVSARGTWRAHEGHWEPR
jgi:WXXGXW repeat (2 copies)